MERNPVPFVQAFPATASRCVHRFENRMTVHRGLFPVIGRISCSKLLSDKILCVFSDNVDAFIIQVLLFLFGKLKARPEF